MMTMVYYNDDKVQWWGTYTNKYRSDKQVLQ